MTEEQYHQLGMELIETLQLKRRRGDGRVETTWGDKNPAGLAKTVETIIEKAKQ